MSHIKVEVQLHGSPADVWADIIEIESHAEWMDDAESIRFTGELTKGVGTTFDCDTKVGPLRFTDRMEITEWIDERVMGVRHAGLITGEGRFTLEPVAGDRTRFVWEEDLRFPWWLGGPLGAGVGTRVLKRIWQRNLRSLQRRFG